MAHRRARISASRFCLSSGTWTRSNLEIACDTSRLSKLYRVAAYHLQVRARTFLRRAQGVQDPLRDADQTASSQMDGIRGMLDALMRPPPGARPLLDLAGSATVDANGAAAAANGSGGTVSGGDALPAEAPNPARSLMGAIAKGVMLQREKERRQVCSRSAASLSFQGS